MKNNFILILLICIVITLGIFGNIIFPLKTKVAEQNKRIIEQYLLIWDMSLELKKQKDRSAKMDSLHYQWCGWELRDGLKSIPVKP